MREKTRQGGKRRGVKCSCSSRFSGRAADVHLSPTAGRLSWRARQSSPEVNRRGEVMPVAEPSSQPVRGQKTICMPCSQEQYERIVDDPAQFRACLDRQIEATPDLFPPEIRQGYRMKDLYT